MHRLAHAAVERRRFRKDRASMQTDLRATCSADQYESIFLFMLTDIVAIRCHCADAHVDQDVHYANKQNEFKKSFGT